MTQMRIRPMLMIVLMNILGFMLLYIFRQESDVHILYAMAVMCLLNISVYAVMSVFELGDVYFYLIVSMLVSIGIIMLFRLDPENGYSQLKWFCAGTAIFFASYFAYRAFKFWSSLTYFYIGAAIVLYLVTLIFGYSQSGSKNWIKIASYSVQPSEFIKIFFCMALASLFSKRSGAKSMLDKLAGIHREDIILAAFVYVCIGFATLFYYISHMEDVILSTSVLSKSCLDYIVTS